MTSYEIVRYSPEFRPQVIRLLEHLVSSDKDVNDAYFKWKHEDNPYVAEPVVFLALAGQSVVGMRAFQGARFSLGIGEGTVSWLAACDLVVEPAHRGQHLFGRIMRYALDDLARRDDHPILNWSGSPFTYLASLRMGWNLVGAFAPWALEPGTIPASWRLRDRMRGWRWFWRHADREMPLLSRPGFANLDLLAKRSSTGISVTSSPPVDAMAELAARGQDHRIRHERDARYYRWRFANPLSEYRFLLSHAPGREGFLVLQRRRGGASGEFRVVEWEVSGTEGFETLLETAMAAGGFRRFSLWSATLGPELQQCLKRSGFRPMDDTHGHPAYHPGLLASGSGDARYFRDLGDWDLRMAYSDAY